MPLEGRRPQAERRCGETGIMPRHEGSVETKRQRIAEKASRDPNFQFTSLFHLMNDERLLECVERLRKDAAAGIDGVTKDEYVANLTENVHDLVERLQRMAYRPLPVQRVSIPKPGSAKQRPLGIQPLRTSWCKPDWSEVSRRSMNRTSLAIPMDSGLGRGVMMP